MNLPQEQQTVPRRPLTLPISKKWLIACFSLLLIGKGSLADTLHCYYFNHSDLYINVDVKNYSDQLYIIVSCDKELTVCNYAYLPKSSCVLQRSFALPPVPQKDNKNHSDATHGPTSTAAIQQLGQMDVITKNVPMNHHEPI